MEAPSQGVDPPRPSGSAATKPPGPKSGFVTALEYTGIPASWLRKPKLPSRNWLIFIGTTSSILSLYVYDRREAKRIKQSYIDRVKHLAEEPMKTWELPRKLTVYACKWPGDEEYESSMKYFKRYMKPVLAAAGLDYEINNGNQHGALARVIAERIKSRRRIALGLEEEPPKVPLPRPADYKFDEREHELKGGVVVVGRHSFKEYMEGLRRGWTESLEKVDREEALSRILENDGHFDEPEEEQPADQFSQEESSTEKPEGGSPQTPIVPFSPLARLRLPPREQPKPQAPAEPPVPSHLDIPPSTIPPQPPLLFLPYKSIVGFLNIPRMIIDFFNERHHVKNGCEAAYRVIMDETREFQGPSLSESSESASSSQESESDLSFGVDQESDFRGAYDKLPKDIEGYRKKYYEALPAKLTTARALARGEREPTKDEKTYPPPTEVELAAERLKKEMNWRDQLEGYEILKKGSPVAWDDRFRGSLRVFVDPPKEDS
ncbi:mitochondrial import inner membrane translocase subunit tim54 [Tulasnella sp. 418]|nr:mitochondrial import inner membrane translocase subunit tim54 [Tulasnella sp. 418]